MLAHVRCGTHLVQRRHRRRVRHLLLSLHRVLCVLLYRPVRPFAPATSACVSVSHMPKRIILPFRPLASLLLVLERSSALAR